MHTRKSTAAAAAASHAPDRSDRAGKRRPDRSPSSASTRPPSETSVTSATSVIGAAGKRWTLSPEIEAEIAEIAAACGCELIHAEWKGGVLRLVLDRPPAPAAPAAPAAINAEPAAAAAPSGAPLAPLPPLAPLVPLPLETAGVSLGDCEQVAKQTSALLDVLDFGNGRYLLEVSSPGLDRQLYRPSDYQRFLGRLARVTYQQAESPADAADPAASAASGMPRRRTVVARLAELRPPASGSGAGTVTLVDDRTGERVTLKLEDVRMARLEVEL
jgi:ribosome maturation factor RimP